MYKMFYEISVFTPFITVETIFWIESLVLRVSSFDNDANAYVVLRRNISFKDEYRLS